MIRKNLIEDDKSVLAIFGQRSLGITIQLVNGKSAIILTNMDKPRSRFFGLIKPKPNYDDKILLVFENSQSIDIMISHLEKCKSHLELDHKTNTINCD